jgi:hypothetical protein
LKERAEILSKPRVTESRPGDFRPFDISYLNIMGAVRNQAALALDGEEMTVDISHLSITSDFPRIGAHIATPLSHLGPVGSGEPKLPSIDFAVFREPEEEDYGSVSIRHGEYPLTFRMKMRT